MRLYIHNLGMGSPPRVGSSHFLTRGDTREQPENIQFPVLR